MHLMIPVEMRTLPTQITTTSSHRRNICVVIFFWWESVKTPAFFNHRLYQRKGRVTTEPNPSPRSFQVVVEPGLRSGIDLRATE